MSFYYSLLQNMTQFSELRLHFTDLLPMLRLLTDPVCAFDVGEATVFSPLKIENW